MRAGQAVGVLVVCALLVPVGGASLGGPAGALTHVSESARGATGSSDENGPGGLGGREDDESLTNPPPGDGEPEVGGDTETESEVEPEPAPEVDPEPDAVPAPDDSSAPEERVFAPSTAEATAVYRFWSDEYQSHFYTRSVAERNHVNVSYPRSTWRYEGPVFGAYGTQEEGTIPVFRFWSNRYNAHFYTASESEKNHVIATYPRDVWQYESIAYYAYPISHDPSTTRVMARFWSPTYLNHFYTASAGEATTVRTTYPENIWRFEGNMFRVPTAYRTPEPLPDLGLTEALNSAVSGMSGRYSVSVVPPGADRVTVSVNGGAMQEPVSVIKVFVAYAVLDRIDRGQFTMNAVTRSGVTVGDCLRVTIHVSDNYCHWDLVALVGEQTMNNQFWAEGYRGTVYAGVNGNGTYYPSKLSTTNDLALLLSRLHKGDLLSPELTEHFMTLLETQLWRSKLPSGVNVGVPVANKTGSAWTSAGWYHSDAGVVSAPGGAYSIAVLGSGGATVAGVREISQIVYEYFNGPISQRASYSNLNAVTSRDVVAYRYASTSDPITTIPAGAVVEVNASARTWYQIFFQGSALYVPSSALRDAITYPRSIR